MGYNNNTCNSLQVVEDKAFSEEDEVKVFAEEMWEAGLPEPYQNMVLPEMVEYLESLENREEVGRFLRAVYWSGFQACLDYEDSEDIINYRGEK